MSLRKPVSACCGVRSLLQVGAVGSRRLCVSRVPQELSNVVKELVVKHCISHFSRCEKHVLAGTSLRAQNDRFVIDAFSKFMALGLCFKFPVLHVTHLELCLRECFFVRFVCEGAQYPCAPLH